MQTVTVEISPDEARYLAALPRMDSPTRPRNSLSARLLFKLKNELVRERDAS